MTSPTPVAKIEGIKGIINTAKAQKFRRVSSSQEEVDCMDFEAIIDMFGTPTSAEYVPQCCKNKCNFKITKEVAVKYR